ncbi:hypothetical protein PC116_g20985 [Phytophthora cactorum]|nr:hypothetical protein PC116_g20985 [Phytophthora cactorum]
MVLFSASSAIVDSAFLNSITFRFWRSAASAPATMCLKINPLDISGLYRCPGVRCA